MSLPRQQRLAGGPQSDGQTRDDSRPWQEQMAPQRHGSLGDSPGTAITNSYQIALCHPPAGRCTAPRATWIGHCGPPRTGVPGLGTRTALWPGATRRLPAPQPGQRPTEHSLLPGPAVQPGDALFKPEETGSEKGSPWQGQLQQAVGAGPRSCQGLALVGCGEGVPEVQPVGARQSGVRWAKQDAVGGLGEATGEGGPGACKWQGAPARLSCGSSRAARGQQAGDDPLQSGCFVIASGPQHS